MPTLPFRFQLQDVRRLHRMGGRALVVWDPGLGKTRLALDYLHRHPDAMPAVVVCPAPLKLQWMREAAHHFGIRAGVLGGTRPAPFGLDAPRLLIVNYEVLRPTEHGPGWVNALRALGVRTVILDESVAIKNQSKTTAAVRALCRGVPHVLALTATPVELKPMELWTTLNLLAPRAYPSRFAFGHRFCLPPDAPILMSDLREMPISEIEIGDEVIGWKRFGFGQRRLTKSKVLAVLTKQSPLQKVTLTDGTVMVCTPDHRWATGLSTKNEDVNYQVARTGRKGGPGPGCASRVMKVFRGTSPQYPPDDRDYMKGYIHGFFRGDGHCVRERVRRTHPFKKLSTWMKFDYRIGCNCNDRQPIARISRYLTALGVGHRRFVREDGMHTIGKMGRRECYEFLTKESVGDTDSWWAGFLGGIYDAEGSGMSIAQYKDVNPITHSMIKEALTRFGFSIREEDEVIHFKGGRKEFLRFWNIANPTLRRKLLKLVMSKGGRLGGGVSEHNRDATGRKGRPFVSSIEPLPGIHTVYTLTTETGNYVAYGCGSKNCSPRKTPWGWKFDGSSDPEGLHRLLLRGDGKLAPPLLVRRRKEDVIEQLPEKIRSVVPLEMSDPAAYEKADGDFLGWVARTSPGRLKGAARSAGLRKAAELKKLAAELKLPAVCGWVDNWFAGGGGKLLLFAHHKAVVKKLHDRYRGRSVVVDGGVTGAKRQAAVDQFQKNARTDLLIGSSAAYAGLNLTAAQATAFVELGFNPADILQAEGRGYARMSDVHGMRVFFLVASGTVEDRLVRILQRRWETANAVVDGKKDSVDRLDLFDRLVESLRRGR